MLRLIAIVGVTMAVTLVICGPATAAPVAATQFVPGPDATGAGAYYRAELATFDALDGDMPKITSAAEGAAKAYVGDDTLQMAALGEWTFFPEMAYRAGGLRQLYAWGDYSPGKWHGILFYSLGFDSGKYDAQQTKQYTDAGDKLIAFGSAKALADFANAGGKADWMVENHAVETDGVFKEANGQYSIPTNQLANIAAGWVFTGEFIAACTRLGKMPPIYESIAIPTGAGRNDKLQNVRFEPMKPYAVAPGRFGHEYLAALRRDLNLVHAGELSKIKQLAAICVAARKANHQVTLIVNGHCDAGIDWQQRVPYNYMHVGDGFSGWYVNPMAGDVDIFFSYDRRIWDDKWAAADAQAVKVGATRVYSFTGYRQKEVESVPAGCIYIDQHWAYGDADVVMPGYDVRILPASGIIQLSILFWTMSEMRDGMNAPAVAPATPAR